MQQETKIPKLSSNRPSVSSKPAFGQPGTPEVKTPFTYDDYDSLSEVMLSREHLLHNKQSLPRPPTFYPPDHRELDRKMNKYRFGLETITEQSNDFSIQKFNNSALRSATDPKSFRLDTASPISPERSKQKMAGSADGWASLSNTANKRDSKAVKEYDVVNISEVSDENSNSNPKEDIELAEGNKEQVSELRSQTHSIESTPGSHPKEAFSSMIKPAMTECIDLLASMSKTFNERPESLRKEFAKAENQIEEIEHKACTKEVTVTYETINSTPKVTLSNEMTVRERDIITIDEASPCFMSSRSSAKEAEPVFQPWQSEFDDSSIKGQWSYYDKISQLSTALRSKSFNSLKDVKSLVASIEKKSLEIEKLTNKLNSPALRAMEELILGFAKRRSDCSSSVRDSIPLLALSQVELVDAVWKGNSETIIRYQNGSSNKKDTGIKFAASSYSADREVVKHEHILEKLTFKNLRTLKPGTWLNDEVVNAYLRLVDSDLEACNPRVRVVNTFFLDQFIKESGNSAKILRILSRRRINVKELDQLFVPINTNNMHWSFLMLDLVKGKATYCDSLSNPSIPSQKELLGLARMLQTSRGNAQDEFCKITLHPTFCKQNNLVDCGVFMLKGIDELSRFSRLSFSQADVDYLRHLICFELIQGRFLQN